MTITHVDVAALLPLLKRWKFEKWLKTKPETMIVGSLGQSGECSLVKFLLYTVGPTIRGCEYTLTVAFGYLYLFEGHNKANKIGQVALPLWAQAFDQAINRTFLRHISANTALDILGKIKENDDTKKT